MTNDGTKWTVSVDGHIAEAAASELRAGRYLLTIYPSTNHGYAKRGEYHSLQEAKDGANAFMRQLVKAGVFTDFDLRT